MISLFWKNSAHGLVLSFVIFFVVKADIYLAYIGFLPVAPSTAFVVLFSPVVLFTLLIILYSGNIPIVFQKCKSIILSFFAIVLISLIGVIIRFSTSIIQDHRALYLPLLDFSVLLIGFVVGGWQINQKLWKLFILVGLSITVATIFIDIFIPHTFTLPELEGASGLPQNPNGGAYVTLFLMVSALRWEKKSFHFFDAVIMTVSVLAIFYTASRSGILLTFVVISIYLYRLISLRQIISIVKLMVFLSLFGVILFYTVKDFMGSNGLLTHESSKLNMLSRIDSATLSFTDNATQERIQAIFLSLDLISERPLWGTGTGYTYDMIVGPHNMYLSRLIDNGLLGLIIYICFLATAFGINRRYKNTEGLIITLITILYGFFSHNVLEDRTMLLLLSISIAKSVVEFEKYRLTTVRRHNVSCLARI